MKKEYTDRKSSKNGTLEKFGIPQNGIAGLVGLALSLARIPPRLPRFCPLSHRRRENGIPHSEQSLTSYTKNI